MFKQIYPARQKSFESVKVAFRFICKSKSKNKFDEIPYAHVVVTIDLLDKLGWEHDTRALVYFDDENPKVWMIKKANKNEKNSFKFLKCKENSRVIQFKFREFIVKKTEIGMRIVNHTIEDGNLIIDLTRD